MERKELSLTELFDRAKRRKMQRLEDDEKFETECSQEIETLERANERKLARFDEELGSSKDLAEKAAGGALAKLKKEHELQLRTVRQRHEEELAKLEEETKQARKGAVKSLRDQKKTLESAYREAIAKKKEEHAKLREKREEARTADDEAEKLQVLQAFQRDLDKDNQATTSALQHPSTESQYLSTESRHPSREPQPRSVTEEQPAFPFPSQDSASLVPSSLTYSPGNTPVQPPLQTPTTEAESESNVEIVEPVEPIQPVEPVNSTPARIDKSKKPAEIEDSQSENGNVASVTEEDTEEREIEQQEDNQTDSAAEEVNVSAETRSSAPSGKWAFADRYYRPLPPAPAPSQPPATPNPAQYRQAALNPAQRYPAAPNSSQRYLAASNPSQRYPAAPNPFQRYQAAPNPSQRFSMAPPDAPRGPRPTKRDREENSQTQHRDSERSNKQKRRDTKRNSMAVRSSLDVAPFLNVAPSSLDVKDVSPNLPIFSTQSASPATHRAFVDHDSIFQPREVPAVVPESYILKKIQCKRRGGDDEGDFIWEQKEPGKAELRLSDNIYKVFTMNIDFVYYKLSQGCDMENWYIVPGDIKTMRCNQSLGFLHVTRDQTELAVAELWVMFESGKIMMDFLSNFCSRPRRNKVLIVALDDSVQIPTFKHKVSDF